MARKRMFSMKIVDSGSFLDLPLSSQCLYFHLNMRSDDDGFCDNPKQIMKMIGASEDDLRLLLVKKFVLAFESGLIVIKHWRMHNTLQSDRYEETPYKEEKSMLFLDENKAYTFSETKCFQNVSTVKNSIDKNSIDKFIKPTVDDVKAYIKEKSYHFSAEAFVAFYESNGWKVGKNPMKNWKSACVTWESKYQKPIEHQPKESTPPAYQHFEYDETPRNQTSEVDILGYIEKAKERGIISQGYKYDTD